MASATRSDRAADDRPWFVVGRWREFEGEQRANLLRLVGIGAFYIIELINHHGLRLGPLEMPAIRDAAFHRAVTALAVAWAMMALAVQLCLRRRIFPTWLKYATTGADLVLLTSVLGVADGPRSPLVAAYFVVLAMATLRFSLPLIRAATVGAMLGYLGLLAYGRYFARGRDLSVPRYHELMVLLALGLTGITLGQAVRQVRAVAREYAERRAAEETPAA